MYTRDLEKIELDAITQAEKSANKESYKGVIKVDPSKAPRQYALTNARYTPILEHTIKGSFHENIPWIGNLPTGVLKVIRDHPVLIGRVLRFFSKTARTSPPTGDNNDNQFLGIRHVLTMEDMTDLDAENVTPTRLLRCRHVQIPESESEEYFAGWSEHFEYLVQFDNGKVEQVEWYPEELVAQDLKSDYCQRTRASAKRVDQCLGQEGDALIVQRPDGTTEKDNQRQLFWKSKSRESINSTQKKSMRCSIIITTIMSTMEGGLP